MSDSNSLLLNAQEALVKAGVQVGEIYRMLGVDPVQLLKPGVRTPHAAQVPFWAAAEVVSGDPEIGLHICPFISPLAGEVVNSLFANSIDVRAGIESVLSHLSLVSDHVFLKMTVNAADGVVRIAGKIGEAGVPRHNEIVLTYTMLKMLRIGSSGKFDPIHLGFRFKSNGRDEEFVQVFGCTVYFEQPECFMCFPMGMLDIPHIHADSDLQEAQRVAARRKLRQVSLHRAVKEVRRAIEARLADGAPTLGQVANDLYRPERTVRSDLQSAGTNFNDVVASVQQAIAERLLASTSMPVEQIGYSVGFAERSAFFRAFKRWTDLTPAQYRRSRQSEVE